MPLHAAFKGHGTFVFNAKGTLQRFEDASGAGPGLVKAFKSMGFTLSLGAPFWTWQGPLQTPRP